jgi:hypothetical protein
MLCGGARGCGKFCRDGINCRGRRIIFKHKNPNFIGFFVMARRLLIFRAETIEGRRAAFVGALPWCLFWALHRPHWMPSNR